MKVPILFKREDEKMNEEYLEISSELKKELWKVPVELDLIRDARISNGAFRLYLNLLGYARIIETCFPSRNRLAEDLGCTIRHIDRMKEELKTLGLLDWKTNIGKDGREHNTYTLLKYKPIQKNDLTGDNNVLIRETKMSPVQGHRCLSNNTNNNNTKNNSSTTTINAKTDRSFAPAEGQRRFNTNNKYNKIYSEYIKHIDSKYILQPRDIKSLDTFKYNDDLVQYIKYWKDYTSSKIIEDGLLKGNNHYYELDDFDKQHTAKIHIIIKHWNNFKEYAQMRFRKENRTLCSKGDNEL